MSACEQGNLEVIKVLIGTGGPQLLEFVSTGGTPLHAAISCDVTAQQQHGEDGNTQQEQQEIEGGLRAYQTV